MSKSLNLLGMAKKAGLLAVGGEAVSTATRHGKALLVITANDASEGAVRRARINAETGGAVYIGVPFTRFELGTTAGRGSPGTIAFLDAGLAATFAKGLAHENPEQYGEAVGKLEERAATIREKNLRRSQTQKTRSPTGKKPPRRKAR